VSRSRLAAYGAKRDFARTPEPRGGARGRTRSATGGRDGAGGRFVVHEHHARRLHWDLRLERDGALMSWAIPNGIPADPGANRKAIRVEDHPLEYLEFEGEIPQGSYGAGEVRVWDRGSYEAEKLEEDEVIAVFHGERLRGRYALFRTGREERDWMIHRMDPPEHRREPMPEHVRPMLARLARLPREETGWAFEVKWDGVRAIVYWLPGRMRVESRNGNEITGRYPELRALGAALGSREAVLDGEIVAFDERGRPSFERLQRRMHVTSESAIRRLARDSPVVYMIFDLLYLDGRVTMDLPYEERRALLGELGLEGPAWQTPAHRPEGEGAALLRATAELGLEGVVAKRARSPYRPGERSGDWLKVKHSARQELVIGGWLPGKGARAGTIGALLMGYHEEAGRDGRLRYAGRVGTGFDERELARLGEELARRSRPTSPFSRTGPGPPRGARFAEPELVAEVELREWTREGLMRAPAYKGLRPDKPAREVVREPVLARAAQTDAAQDGQGASSERAAAAGRTAAGRAAATRRSGSTRAGDAESVRPRSVRTSTRSRKGPRPSAGDEPPYAIVRETARATEVAVEGRALELSNRSKVLYPRAGFTKGDVIDYYARVAPVLLPHLSGRPVTLKRYPEGVEAAHFYQKRCPAPRPEWVRTAAVPSERNRGPIDYCLVEDLPTLMWAANLANIELHTSLSRADDLERPTAIVFDLDPGPGAGLIACCKVALELREALADDGLRALAKSSGSKGVQLYVPLNGAVSYEQTKAYAHALAQALERERPERVVSRMTRSLRAGKVLIDWSQNDRHKTTVCVYSLRARERPFASTPLHWDEVERGARRRRESELSLGPAELLARVASEGDLFAEVLSAKQRLPRGSPGARA
jgi:bifunctional non-homologous end joining protein LigD